MLMLLWPMNVESAFALTPAEIIIEAKVWRPSCGVRRSSPAASQASSARACAAGQPLELRFATLPVVLQATRVVELLSEDERVRVLAEVVLTGRGGDVEGVREEAGWARPRLRELLNDPRLRFPFAPEGDLAAPFLPAVEVAPSGAQELAL